MTLWAILSLLESKSCLQWDSRDNNKPVRLDDDGKLLNVFVSVVDESGLNCLTMKTAITEVSISKTNGPPTRCFFHSLYSLYEIDDDSKL